MTQRNPKKLCLPSHDSALISYSTASNLITVYFCSRVSLKIQYFFSPHSARPSVSSPRQLSIPLLSIELNLSPAGSIDGICARRMQIAAGQTTKKRRATAKKTQCFLFFFSLNSHSLFLHVLGPCEAQFISMTKSVHRIENAQWIEQ